MLDEVLDSEQEHEVVRSVLGCRGTSDESIDEVSRLGDLRTGEVSKKKNKND
jgi:hypothetical protein